MGAEQVLDGLDKAVMAMKKGEVAILTIPPECAYGSSGSQQELAQIPPNSTLYYEIELVSFVKVTCISYYVPWFMLCVCFLIIHIIYMCGCFAKLSICIFRRRNHGT